jgi:signal transduction histidine kinase
MTSALAVVCLVLTATVVGLRVRVRSRLERVARAVHELRSPLCAARLAVHAAARDHGWPALAPIDRELERATAAFDDLDAARTGSRVPDRIEDFDAGDLLDEVARTWGPLGWPVDRTVRVEPSLAAPVVRADRQRVAQALGNLVGNALEHGAGTVMLRAEVDRGRARLVVEDRGEGLPSGLAALTRRPRAGRGARGRGLAIVEDIARRHGGRLLEERSTGRFRMVLELPLPAAEPQPSIDVDGVGVRLPSWTFGGVVAREDADPLGGLRWGGLARIGRRRVERADGGRG